ncbi:MAG: ATP-binding protein [Aquisalinus sp.]|nr:ATP-binding protein [Aquisalinus sp.]
MNRTQSSSQTHRPHTPEELLHQLQDPVDEAPATVKAGAPRMPVGQVVSVNGSHVLVMINLDKDFAAEFMPRVGGMICIESKSAEIVAGVSGLSSPAPGLDSEEERILIAEVELYGEIRHTASGSRAYARRIAALPSLGDVAAALSEDDLHCIYRTEEAGLLKVGTISNAPEISAQLSPAALLQENFALFGAPGCGTSAAAAVLARAFVKARFPVRTLIIDVHNEYSRSFGRAASIVPVVTGTITHWMLSLREMVYLTEKATGPLSEQEKDLLIDSIIAAKKRYVRANPSASSNEAAEQGVRITADTPVPYRLGDIVVHLKKVLQASNDIPADVIQHMETRMEVLSKEPRYKPIFGRLALDDSLTELLSEIFRMPLAGKSISVLQLGGLEEEVAEVVVSVVARFARMIAEARKDTTPLLIMLEEAHRFLPMNVEDAPLASQSLQTILEAGNKLSVSLGLITSRLRGVSSNALEHIDNYLAMCLPGRADQDHFLETAPESAPGILENVGGLENGECIAVGLLSPVPARLTFTRLPADAVPRDPARVMTTEQSAGSVSHTDLDEETLFALIEQMRFGTD